MNAPRHLTPVPDPPEQEDTVASVVFAILDAAAERAETEWRKGLLFGALATIALGCVAAGLLRILGVI